MDLEIRHLKLVREVSAAGSLTRAGAALHLTQSALSHQLRDIESRLGTALFLRVGKRMVLTPAGERLLRSADEVLGDDRANRRRDPAASAARSAGVLRLTTECYTCYHWLPRAVEALSPRRIRRSTSASTRPRPPSRSRTCSTAASTSPSSATRCAIGGSSPRRCSTTNWS